MANSLIKLFQAKPEAVRIAFVICSGCTESVEAMAKSFVNGKYAALLFQALFIALLTAAIIAAFYYFDAASRLESFIGWIEELGPWAASIFVLLYIVFPILFLPVTVLTIGAGILFGFLKGFSLVTIAATLSAVISFLLGRYLLRDWVRKQCRKNKELAVVEKMLVKDGWKIVAMSRMSPVMPFWLLNYFYGSTKVPLKIFAWASFLSLLPKSAVYVAIGSVGGSFTAEGETSAWKTGLYLFGIAVTFLLSFYLTFRAKQALEGRLKTSKS